MDRTLPTLFAELDDFLTALSEARHRALAGLSLAPRPRDVRRQFPAYSRPESFAAAREALDSPATDERKKGRLRLLLPFLAREVEDRLAEDADDARRAFESMAHVAVGDEHLAFQEAVDRLTAEPSRERRALIERTLGDLLLDHHATHARRVEAAIQAAEALGQPSYRALHEGASGRPLEPLLAASRVALAASDDAYRDLLSYFLRKLDPRLRPLPGGGAQRHDLSRLSAAEWLQVHFTREDLLAVPARWLGELGLAPDAGKQIAFDAEPRAGKAAWPVAVPISVPGKISVLLHPAAGLDRWEGLLHALGMAHHLAGADAEVPVEQRRLGDGGVREAHALLFRHLLLDEGWLRRYLRLPATTAREAARAGAFNALARLRLDCARLAYELQLYARGPGRALADEHADHLRGALFVAPHRGFFLAEVEPHLAVADRLRGRALEAELQRHLQESFNEDWWRNPGARAFLGRLHARGGRDDAEAVARELGAESLSLPRAAARLVSVLAR
jgi:hypothetical protein